MCCEGIEWFFFSVWADTFCLVWKLVNYERMIEKRETKGERMIKNHKKERKKAGCLETETSFIIFSHSQ